MTSGARTLMTSWNAVIAPNAQIHQSGPVRSMNQKRPEQDGDADHRGDGEALQHVDDEELGVVLLNPNRASMAKIEYTEKGRREHPEEKRDGGHEEDSLEVGMEREGPGEGVQDAQEPRQNDRQKRCRRHGSREEPEPAVRRVCSSPTGRAFRRPRCRRTPRGRSAAFLFTWPRLSRVRAKSHPRSRKKNTRKTRRIDCAPTDLSFRG